MLDSFAQLNASCFARAAPDDNAAALPTCAKLADDFHNLMKKA